VRLCCAHERASTCGSLLEQAACSRQRPRCVESSSFATEPLAFACCAARGQGFEARSAPTVRLWERDANHRADERREEEVGEELGVGVEVVAERKEEEDQNHFLDGPADSPGIVSISPCVRLGIGEVGPYRKRSSTRR
jgi:hypothetical protein